MEELRKELIELEHEIACDEDALEVLVKRHGTLQDEGSRIKNQVKVGAVKAKIETDKKRLEYLRSVVK